MAAQAYAPIEHVVVDGASTDGTVDVLRSHEADGLRWVSEPDSGMYEAVNKGLAMATGEILGYLNSDDALLPWAVESVVAAFEARPEVDVVYGDGVRLDERTGAQRLRLFPPFDRGAIAAFESLMQPAVFWRRRLMDRIGPFDASLRFVGDLDYWLRAAAAGSVPVHLDEVLAVERVHAGALTESQRDAMAEEDRAMRQRHLAETGGEIAAPAALRWHRIWQRRLWLRFLAAQLSGDPTAPWPRFRADGGLRVSIPRVLAGQLPRGGDRFLPNAVVSRLAEDVLRG